MFEFKKKETLIQNIAFMALMGAINLIITLLMTFIPFIIAITLFFLPLTSVLVTIYCKKKYFIFYFLTTVGLCLLVTMYNITDTLFFVIPSMISGFLFGIMMEHKISSIYLVIIPALVNLGFTYLSLPFIELIYGFNFIDTIASALALNDFLLLDVITPTAILCFCLIQSLFSYMVIKEELKVFKLDYLDSAKYKMMNVLINGLLIILIIIFAFIYLPLAYIFFVLSLILSMYFIIEELLEKKKWIYIYNICSLVLTFIIFSVCYSLIGSAAGLLLISVFSLFSEISYSVNIYLQYREKIATIKDEEK